MPSELRDFLALSYDELEQLNLKAKEQRQNHVAADKVREDRLRDPWDTLPGRGFSRSRPFCLVCDSTSLALWISG